MKVSIIILNYNGKRFLKDCINSVLKQTYKDYEVILVDNGSSDDSAEYVKKQFPSVKVVRNEENLGFAEGNNLGVRHAKGKYICLLNNDTVVNKEWLEEKMKIIEGNPLVRLVGGNVIDFHTKTEDDKWKGTSNLLLHNIRNLDVDESFYYSGCSLLYDRSIVDEPFDKDYFLYAEDIYLCWLFRLKGYHMRLSPKSRVEHFGSATSKKTPKLKLYYSERNRIMNLLIFYSRWNIIRVMPLLLVQVIIRDIVDIFTGRFFSRLKAQLWCLFNLGKVLKKRKFVQGQRRVNDKDIVRYMSSKIVSGKRILHKIINSISYLYCFILRIKTLEMQ
ncbi:glycosyltransferase family 2 protein [Candidatus Woesearchaeota archaeon]|nr:glycosyltransferase family 2 protein [Candidatus Woesearchaeota archaeon]